MNSDNKKCLQLALKNSAVMALVVLSVLGLMGKDIPEQTPLISLGYGILSFLSALPAYYLSFKKRWNDSPILSVKRLYTPLLILLTATPVALFYSSLAYGHNPVDFFVTDYGMIWMFFRYAILAIVLLYVIQLMGASNEREIIVNSSPSKLRKESEEEKEEPSEYRLVHIQGGTKSSVFDLDIDRFLYAESDANYLKIHILGDQQEVVSLRMTIRQFEDATADFPEIVRCHRAFVVNIRNVTYFETSSGKGEAHFSVIQDTVPVSRTYAEAFSQKLRQG